MYDTAADAFVVSGCVMRNAFCVIPCVRNAVRFISLSASDLPLLLNSTVADSLR